MTWNDLLGRLRKAADEDGRWRHVCVDLWAFDTGTTEVTFSLLK